MFLHEHLFDVGPHHWLSALTQQTPGFLNIIESHAPDAPSLGTSHDGITVYMVHGVRREHHERTLAVYPHEEFTRTHMHLIRLLLTSHGVAIGTIVHAR